MKCPSLSPAESILIKGSYGCRRVEINHLVICFVFIPLVFVCILWPWSHTFSKIHYILHFGFGAHLCILLFMVTIRITCNHIHLELIISTLYIRILQPYIFIWPFPTHCANVSISFLHVVNTLRCSKSNHNFKEIKNNSLFIY